jgi:predicted ATP-grasp superfamily ATP-dependent carboligase
MAVNGHVNGARVTAGAEPAGPILIGFAGALAAPEAAESLIGEGLEVTAFAPRGSRPALRRHRRVRVDEITPPDVSANDAVADLADLARARGAIALMPLDDASLWLCDRAAARLGGVPVIGPTGEQARLAVDKRLQIAAARRAGLSVPDTRIAQLPDDILGLDAFPLVLKPSLAIEERGDVLSRGSARVCAGPSELAAAAGQLVDSFPLLAQPWLRGTGEGLFGIAVGGEVLHWSAHRRLRMVNPQGSGSSACVSLAPDPQLTEAGARMMRDVGWDGLFMLEFLRDRDGTAWFMELNGRAWGSLALARRLGLEYPAWAARARLRPESRPDPVVATPSQPVVCRHLGREILHLASVIRGPRSAALDEWPSRWGALRDVARVRRSERWYNWSSARRPGVFFDDTLQTVLEPVRRRSTR